MSFLEQVINDTEGSTTVEQQYRIYNDGGSYEHWKLMCMYESVDDFNRGCDLSDYNKCRINRPLYGIRRYYSCKSRGCNNQMQAFFPSNSGMVMVFWNKNKHVHVEVESERFNKKKVESIIGSDWKRKPKRIVRLLMEKNVKVTDLQVQNYKQREKKKICDHPNMNVDELIAWCQLHNIVPDGCYCHTVFVSSYQFYDNDCFRFILTTRRLLEMAAYSNVIEVDATYKIIHNNFPLIVCGVSDKRRRFHPVAYQLCVTEKTEDYEFLFKNVLFGVNSICGKSCQFQFVMADAAPAIKSAAINVFGNRVTNLMCWFHCKQAVEKRIKSIKNDEFEQLITCHISIIQLSADESEFVLSTKLFLDYWKDKSPQVNLFLSYFYENWVKINSKWFEGAAPNRVSTNNGLESHNRIIKDDGIFRTREMIGMFLNEMSTFICDESKDRDGATGKTFSDEVEISRKDYVSAYKVYSVIKNLGVKEMAVFYLNEDLTLGSLKTTFEDINQYYNYKNNTYKITNGSVITCSCKGYQKGYFCSHSIAMDVLMERRRFPTYLSGESLCVKRKRGRPRNITPALVRQIIT